MDRISDFGHLLLPTTAPAAPAVTYWMGDTANVILTGVSILLLIFCLSDLLKLVPTLLTSLSLRRGGVEIEHNINTAHRRNAVAFCLLPSFVVLMERFGVWQPDFLGNFGPGMKILLCATAPVAAFVWRTIAAGFCFGTKPGDEEKAAAKGVCSLFVILVTVCLPVSGILILCGVPDHAICTVLRVATYIFIFTDTIRTGENLSFKYGGLTTILYLCALEIIPVGILVWMAACA